MSTFIDIGSYKGEEIEWAMEDGYEVHAFEPNPNMKKYLDKYQDRVTINYAAAWDKDGIGKLYTMFNPEPGEDGFSLIKEKSNNSKEDFIEVPTINIGRYLKELDKDIDILKINAEGAGYVIIESILDHFDPKRIKDWFLEDHSGYIESEEWFKHREKVLNRLKDLGITINSWRSIVSLNNFYGKKLLGPSF